MTAWITAALLVLLSAGHLFAADPIRVTTWNLEWFPSGKNI
jgi:hypothetical protein